MGVYGKTRVVLFSKIHPLLNFDVAFRSKIRSMNPVEALCQQSPSFLFVVFDPRVSDSRLRMKQIAQAHPIDPPHG